VLFSEPKIPQYSRSAQARMTTVGFSALQRAENSSIRPRAYYGARRRCFSALQRAENSSIIKRRYTSCGNAVFQCSSASRKFLNSSP